MQKPDRGDGVPIHRAPPPIDDANPRAHGRVRTATLADLKYISSLQKKFTNQIGFLPTAALVWLLEHHRIELATENDEPCGYICGRTHLAQAPLLRPITQAAVQFDAQRRHNGLALLDAITAQAQAAGQIGLQANCREGLDANAFWAEAGFKPICILTPQNRRQKEIICWRKPLTNKLPVWFAMPPRRAGYRAFLTTSTRNPRKDYHELKHAVRPRNPAK